MKKYTFLPVLLSVGCLAFLGGEWGLFIYPSYFPAPIYQFENNPLKAEKVALGRVLFYDPILSRDHSTSCASCHSPYNAFAHTDHDLSHGIDDQIGTRNAPPLFNLAWQKSFMWDGAINHLDMQALAPISHPKEMGASIEEVVKKLQANTTYPILFAKAFGDSIVTGQHLLQALSQFQLTLVSANAKYDEVKAGLAAFSAQEENGYALYQRNCSSCHTEPLFSSYEMANNGLPLDTTLNDFGRGAITKQAQDSMEFKIPSLRNLSYTYPYMHDGRFRKLRHVIQHYTEGIQDSEFAATDLKNPIHLTSNEKADLIAFLLTLNDKAFVFDPKHQFPRESFSIEK